MLKIFWLASLTAPLSLNERSLGEAGEEQIKFALAVAHALIAAADASITTTQVEPLSPTINVRQKSINLLPLEFSLPFRDTMQGKGLWVQAIIRELERQDNKIHTKIKEVGERGHLKSADTDQNIINGRWRHCSLSLRLTLALSLSLSRLLHSWIVFHSSLSRLAFSHKVDPELAVDIQNGVGDNSADIELELVDPELAVDIQNGVGDNSADIELELGNDGAMIGSSFETTSNDGH
nr:hypothetical protein CFP56_72287 [Quercus suber]